jgi:hypothetical protein
LAGSGQPPSWQPQNIESSDLAAGLRAAIQLQALAVPPTLAKHVASYILRAGNELESRDSGDAEVQPTE